MLDKKVRKGNEEGEEEITRQMPLRHPTPSLAAAALGTELTLAHLAPFLAGCPAPSAKPAL